MTLGGIELIVGFRPCKMEFSACSIYIAIVGPKPATAFCSENVLPFTSAAYIFKCTSD